MASQRNFASLDDMRKFQNAVGMTGESANATGLHKRLFDAARAAGHVTMRNDGTERLSAGVPDMVSLFNLYDPAPPSGMPEWLYRFLSGNTHAREWALMRGAVEAEVEGFDTGMNMNMIRVDLQALCFLANRTVSIVSRAVAAHVRYRTHPHSPPPPPVTGLTMVWH